MACVSSRAMRSDTTGGDAGAIGTIGWGPGGALQPARRFSSAWRTASGVTSPTTAITVASGR